MAHEGAGEEAARKAREAGGVSDPCASRLAEETHLTCPGPQRVQGHGLFLKKERKKEKRVPRIQPPLKLFKLLLTFPPIPFLSLPTPVRAFPYPVPRRGKGVAMNTLDFHSGGKLSKAETRGGKGHVFTLGASVPLLWCLLDASVNY